MNTKVGKIKRKLAVCLIFLLGINSFGAIVSDNDGSAFVTKAEFDALKDSFAKQINDYNASIDGKIDGAIASYLSGLKISKTSEEHIISYTGEPWWSFVNTNAAFKCGDIDLTLESGDTIMYNDAQSHMAWGKIHTNPTFNEKFRERLVDSYDYSTGIGRWVGYVETEQYLSGCTGNYNAHTEAPDLSYHAATISELYSNVWYTLPLDEGQDYILNDFTKEFINGKGYAKTNMWYYAVGSARHPKTTTSRNAYWFEALPGYVGRFGQAGFLRYNRSWNESNYLQRDVICSFKDKLVSRVNDNENIRSWCNDYNNTDIGILDVINFFDYKDWYCGYYYCEANNYSGWCYDGPVDAFVMPSKAWWTGTRTWQNAGAKNRYYSGKMYFGFINPNVTNVADAKCNTTSKLFTDTFDSYISDMESTDGYCETLTYGGVKHLNLVAGLPIFKAEKGDTVSFDLKFRNEDWGKWAKEPNDKDHLVWIKIGSFKENVDPNSDTELIVPKDCTLDGMGKLLSDQSKSSYCETALVIPANTLETIQFEMPKTGYIFIKWAENTSTNWNVGGGLLELEKKGTITRPD